MGFEEQTAESVGAHLGESLAEDALGDEGLKRLWEMNLWTALFMAARRSDEEGCLVADSESECLVGCGVAGVEGDDNAAGEIGEVRFWGERTLKEPQIFQVMLTGEGFGGASEVFAEFDAEDLCGSRTVCEVNGDGKGEVCLTRSEIHDVQRAFGHGNLREKGIDPFDEAGDLPDLMPHGGSRFSFAVGEADGVEDGVFQEGTRSRRFLAIVFWWWHGRDGRSPSLNFMGAVGSRFEGPVACGGEEVCDGPCFVEEAGDFEAAFVRVEIVGGFLGLGAGGKGEGDAALEFDEADAVSEDGGRCDDSGFDGSGEHKFDEGPVGDAFAELGDDFFRAVHGCEVRVSCGEKESALGRRELFRLFKGLTRTFFSDEHQKRNYCGRQLDRGCGQDDRHVAAAGCADQHSVAVAGHGWITV